MALDNSFVDAMPKLGFGLMRLPKLEDGKTIDIEQTSKMVDLFLEAGMKYFDTAYVYDDGRSELAAGEALVKRHPRDSFYLTTKLNAMVAHDEASAKEQFNTSLARTGAGYFDFYLLHALQDNNYQKYEEYHIWEYVKELKAEGKIRHYGFSFHGSPELLEKLLTEHPDVDFIQLQINYADMDNPSVAARKNIEIANAHGVPFTIMEPVKGGNLVNLPSDAQKLMKDHAPESSIASWAVRFAASQKGTLTVLSGMSNLEQMQDNLSYMKGFKPLDDAEMEIIEKVRKILGATDFVPCTACRYCTKGCPMQIPIPDIFKAYNRYLSDRNKLDEAKAAYAEAVSGAGKASDCISCGQCEGACPQRIGIIEKLQEIAEVMF
ncbi:aldo/keto reductase [Butyrivibrio sp. MC2013]|uniref:aldo/keto reductase n=1 Tax=Butyrivibrio sp. MC2013 TaxID=1280686 RepID=UPI0003F8CFE1|nr:aldo/keto reductase [Butyrivibrio sp. MC2013]